MDEQSIVFAFYKNDTLIGYRLDTMGSIGMEYPKIYSYSKEQVETVIKNVLYNLMHEEAFGKALGCDRIAQREKETFDLLQGQKVFELRVLKCPSKEKEFDIEKAEWVVNHFSYPAEEIAIWLQTPENHEIIETHYFSMSGLMELN